MNYELKSYSLIKIKETDSSIMPNTVKVIHSERNKSFFIEMTVRKHGEIRIVRTKPENESKLIAFVSNLVEKGYKINQ